MSRQQAKDPRVSIDVIYDDMVPVTGGAMTGDLTLRGQPAARVFTQSTAPSNPQAGDLWVDTSASSLAVSSGTPVATQGNLHPSYVSRWNRIGNIVTVVAILQHSGNPTTGQSILSGLPPAMHTTFFFGSHYTHPIRMYVTASGTVIFQFAGPTTSGDIQLCFTYLAA